MSDPKLFFVSVGEGALLDTVRKGEFNWLHRDLGLFEIPNDLSADAFPLQRSQFGNNLLFEGTASHWPGHN